MRNALILLASFMLLACGQKGPLYLTKEPVGAEQSAQQTQQTQQHNIYNSNKAKKRPPSN